MEIRRAKLGELDELVTIYDQARAFMRENGNVDQWTNGYPGREVIQRDIISGNSYVCIDSGEIAGVFYFAKEIDPTYATIYEGKWLNKEPYGVVHRIVVAKHNKGVASYCLNWCFNQCHNLKIDTHRDNQPMQYTLMKNGFTYCGIIHLLNGEERLAYQKIK